MDEISDLIGIVIVTAFIAWMNSFPDETCNPVTGCRPPIITHYP